MNIFWCRSGRRICSLILDRQNGVNCKSAYGLMETRVFPPHECWLAWIYWLLFSFTLLVSVIRIQFYRKRTKFLSGWCGWNSIKFQIRVALTLVHSKFTLLFDRGINYFGVGCRISFVSIIEVISKKRLSRLRPFFLKYISSIICGHYSCYRVII